MIRIYLDSQIYRYLKNDSNVSLVSRIMKNSDHFIYFFSSAHISDLQSDPTEKKWDDLRFMEKIVEDNYLVQDKDDFITCNLVTPINVFKNSEVLDLKNTFDPKNLFGLDDLEYNIPELDSLNQQLLQLLDTPFDIGLREHNLPSFFWDSFGDYLPMNTEGITLRDWMIGFGKLLDGYINDSNIYRNLRNNLTPHLMTEKILQKNSILEFNERLKTTPLQKTFVDFINNSINPDGTKNVSKQNFFTNAYLSLDLLGLSKEKSKKVEFKNLINDSNHAYYASFCDYLISNDEGVLEKSRILYNLLNIKTTVVNIESFNQILFSSEVEHEEDINSFIRLLRYDLKEGMIIRETPSLTTGSIYRTIFTRHRYLGFFDRIQIIEREKEMFVTLFNQRTYESQYYLYKEIAASLKIALRLLGYDENYLGEFRDNDKKEINEHKWVGRSWIVENISFIYNINKGSKKIPTFTIGPL